MVSRLKSPTATWLIALLCAPPFAAGDETSDGPAHTFHSALLDNFVGDWQVTHKFGSRRTAENTLHVEWVFNHLFLELHYRDVATPPKYEAIVFIGYDNPSERCVAHWIDVFGGRFSETLGYGKLDEKEKLMSLVFEYPDGLFQNTFRFDPETKTWTSLMRQKNKGKWSVFAEDKFTRDEAKL